jgi:class 3 adenylate cyclase
MRCSSCASENPEGSKFCIECAAPLCKRCTSCGVENLPEAKFCAQCGKSLTAQAGPKATESAVLPDSGREAEHRQLTVMFCDLVGSTALSAQLDPEELRAVVRAYQQTSAAVIERYGGYIAQYLGDGLLVYFGYPAAHEDDAARAVRAGLEIVGAPQHRTVGATPVAHSLQIRIGIHTGPVVVGEMGGGSRHEQLALGETPNIAARVQGLAEPDSVVVSAATQRLVAGLFNCEDLGPRTLKGISTPISAYRVSSEGVAQSRFDAAMHEGLTPLVGRAEELALLQRRWERPNPAPAKWCY